MLNACLHGHRQEHAVALTLACFLGNKAVSPDKSEQQSKELLEAKGEVLRRTGAAGGSWSAIDLMLGDLRPGEPLAFRPFLLVGSPGCGKSWLIRRLDELLNVKVRRYDAAGSSDNSFGGTPKRWTPATPCFPLQCVADTKTANPIVMVDEIDKCGQGSAGSLAQALMPFLERETAHAYLDPCLETECDLSRVNYCMTANDDTKLPSPLRDRIRIIRVRALARSTSNPWLGPFSRIWRRK